MSAHSHPDVVNVMARTSVSRRELVVSALASGFAISVRPVCAQSVITTDSNGLVAGEVQVPTEDADIPAYRALPAQGGDLPVVLVVQEVFGVHEHIKDLCRRFAKLGYFAIAAELFARQGDVHAITDVKGLMPIVSKVPDEQVMRDLDATVEFARKSGRANANKLAIAGFCWGGRVVWLYAAHNPDLKAGAAWYGRLTGEATALQPRNPLDIAADIKAPIIGLYAGKDQGISAKSIQQMRAALKVAKYPTDIEVFPDAQHGFNADYRPSYSAVDARRAWRDMLAWFKKYGAAPS